jgi:type IX secretion system PorP/SprF family membrane protein
MKEVAYINPAHRKTVWKAVILALGLMPGLHLFSQDVPSRTLSIPVYHPMVINPAFVGSKDFTNISLTSKVLKSPDNQILNLHVRLRDAEGTYTNLGLGAYAFQEQLEHSWNTGLAVAGSYHFAVDHQHLHNIAAGFSVKGIFTIPKKGVEQAADTFETRFHPNMDLGIYYYGPQAFAGISATSLFRNPDGSDSITPSYLEIEREFHFYGGYKIVVSKKSGVVVEPSLLISVNDTSFSEIHKHLIPYLKIYLQNFYVGTYLRDLDKFALFFQYQFPRLYTGIFLEFPRIGYLNDDNIIFELSLGLNLGSKGEPFLRYRHW